MKNWRRMLYLKIAKMGRGSNAPVPSIISFGTKIKGNILGGDIVHEGILAPVIGSPVLCGVLRIVIIDSAAVVSAAGIVQSDFEFAVDAAPACGPVGFQLGAEIDGFVVDDLQFLPISGGDQRNGGIRIGFIVLRHEITLLFAVAGGNRGTRRLVRIYPLLAVGIVHRTGDRSRIRRGFR